MNKILYIVGATATGKTALGLKLARLLGGELISADSRQVYEKMDIGSGKDIPKNAQKKLVFVPGLNKKVVVYKTQNTAIWGYDLVKPNEDWSVANYYTFSQAVIHLLHQQAKLPIVVGGSGFYIESIENPPPSLGLGVDKPLRQKLAKLDLTSLQDMLKKMDYERFNSLNNSDVSNPRRLIRAIELANKITAPHTDQPVQVKFDSLMIGLRQSPQNTNNRIEKRIRERLYKGFEKEFLNLVRSGYLAPSFPAASALGYRQWFDVNMGMIAPAKAFEMWLIAEKRYAKRQMTWFNKKSSIRWYEVDEVEGVALVVDYVKNWYHQDV